MNPDDGNLPDGFGDFLGMLDDYKKKLDALTLFSELIQGVLEAGDPDNLDEESLDRVLDSIIRYGDVRIMDYLNQSGGKK